MKSRMDIAVVLLAFFLMFDAKGYYSIASVVILPLVFFTVNAMARLRRMLCTQ